MQYPAVFWSAVVGLVSIAMCGIGVAQEHATAPEVVAKVKQAADVLAKGGAPAQFGDKSGPWVWKDTYVWVNDCDKKVQVSHPIRADLNGSDIHSIKGSTGQPIYPADFCEHARKASGTWFEYSWPKPGAKKDSRKAAYCTSAKGTPYVTCGGVYDSKKTKAELTQLTAEKPTADEH